MKLTKAQWNLLTELPSSPGQRYKAVLGPRSVAAARLVGLGLAERFGTTLYCRTPAGDAAVKEGGRG